MKTWSRRHATQLRVMAQNSTHEREGDSDRDSGGIPRIKLKTKLLRSGIVKANSVSKETEDGKTPAVESEPAGPSTPASEVDVELEPEGVVPFAFEAFRNRSRRGEGPRLRARRLRKEAIALGRKWYFTGLYRPLTQPNSRNR